MTRTIAIAGLCVIVSHTLSRTVYQVLLTSIRDEVLDGSNQRAGMLVTATFLAYMVGVAFMTARGGRIEPIVTLVVGLWLSGGGFLVLTVASAFWQLAVGLGLAGLGSSGIWMSIPAIVTGAVTADRRGVVMGFLSSSIGLGLVLVGQLVRLIRQFANDEQAWRPVWIVAAAFTFVLTVLVMALLRPEPTEQADTSLNLNVLRQVDGWVPLTVAYVLFAFIVSSYTPFLGAKLKGDGFSPAHIATLYSLIGASAVFGAVGLGRLSDKIGRRPVLTACLVLMGVSSLLILLGREPFATISVVMSGATSFSFPVVVTATLRDHVTDRAFSNALGAITLIYGVCLVVGPFIAGSIGDSSAGFDLLYGLVGAVAFGAAASIQMIPRPSVGAATAGT